MLQGIASRMLEAVDAKQVRAADDLELLVGETLAIPGQGDDYVAVELRPSMMGALACTLSYIMPGTGIPLEARLNRELRYSQVILKVHGAVESYTALGTDVFFNIQQYRVIPTEDWGVVRKEIERLKKGE
jgi:hypothetical protein